MYKPTEQLDDLVLRIPDDKLERLQQEVQQLSRMVSEMRLRLLDMGTRLMQMDTRILALEVAWSGELVDRVATAVENGTTQ